MTKTRALTETNDLAAFAESLISKRLEEIRAVLAEHQDGATTPLEALQLTRNIIDRD